MKKCTQKRKREQSKFTFAESVKIFPHRASFWVRVERRSKMMVSETTLTREQQQQRREDDNAKTTMIAGGGPASTTSNASTDDKGGLGDSNSRYRSDEEAFQNPTTRGEGGVPCHVLV